MESYACKFFFFFLEANLELNYKMFSIHSFSLNKNYSLLNRGNFIKRKILEKRYKIIELYKFIREKLNRLNYLFMYKRILELILELILEEKNAWILFDDNKENN